MGYAVEVVLVPDGEERGVYVSPEAYEIDTTGLSERAVTEARWGRAVVVDRALNLSSKLGNDLPIRLNPTWELWNRLLLLVLAGHATRFVA
jgi:hypothetical protein